MVSEFYPHYTKIAISWYQMGLRKKHNGFAAFGFFKPGQVWWCPISCEESHQPGITYAIYYTFAILCFDVLVLIFVGRSWRSSGSQDWPFRCRHGRPGWLRAAKLEVFDLPRGGDYSSWTHYFHYFPASHSRAHWQMDTDRLWISRLRRQIATVPLPSSTSRKSRRDFPGPGVFSEHFKWCGQPLFSTSSILFPSISINDQWCRETANKNQPSAQAILQPFFSHWSAGWLNVWMTFVYPPWYFPSRLALTSWRNWSIGRGRDPFETTPSTVPWRVFMGWGSWYFEDVFSDHGEDW